MGFFSQWRKIMKLELDVSRQGERLTNDEYDFIYGGNGKIGKVARICVDALIVSEGKILLAKRNIEPFKGYWALAGGAIKFGESIDQALARILKEELGVAPLIKELIGNIEHYPEGPYKHSISMAYLVKFDGELAAKDQADQLQFFSEIPEHTQPYQAQFLKENWAKIINAAALL